MICHITERRAGRALVRHEVALTLIGAMAPTGGSGIGSERDEGPDSTGAGR